MSFIIERLLLTAVHLAQKVVGKLWTHEGLRSIRKNLSETSNRFLGRRFLGRRFRGRRFLGRRFLQSWTE